MNASACQRMFCLIGCAVLSVLSILPPAIRADDRSKPAGPALAEGTGDINDAIVDLTKEYNAALKSADAKLRDACNYFPEEKRAGITIEALLTGLERRLPLDAKGEAYVKWQLMSCAPPQVPEKLYYRVINIYRQAPQPPQNPGLEHATLDRLLNRAGQYRKENLEAVNQQVQPYFDKFMKEVVPAVSYRNELFRRLPPSFETLVAGMEDFYTRLQQGAADRDFYQGLSNAIMNWAASADADPAQVNAMSRALKKVAQFVENERNLPYVALEWVDSESYKGLRWKKEDAVSVDALNLLAKNILTANNRPNDARN